MYLHVGKCTLWVNVVQPSNPPTDSSNASNQWILLMHGFPDTAAMWQEQIAALSAAGYGVVAPDMPGFGRSTFDEPQELQQYSLRNIVTVMCGLLDALSIEKVTAVGHDWGAAVAWAFALQAPQRLSRLVVLSVGHPGGWMLGRCGALCLRTCVCVWGGGGVRSKAACAREGGARGEGGGWGGGMQFKGLSMGRIVAI